jgi:hypothetical protein
LPVDAALSASLACALSNSIAACKQAMNLSFEDRFIRASIPSQFSMEAGPWERNFGPRGDGVKDATQLRKRSRSLYQDFYRLRFRASSLFLRRPRPQLGDLHLEG